MSAVQAAFTTVDDSARQRSSRISDYLLCALIPLNIAVPLLPVDIPVPEVAVMALALLAMNRRPPPVLIRRPLWFPVLLIVLWGVLAASSFLNGVDGSRRLLHMANFVVLALIIASGRVDTRSAVRGLAASITVIGVVGVVNRFVPFIDSGYGDRLTGLIEDPNVAGYYLVVFGCLGLAVIRRTQVRWLVAALLVLAISLTLSRTSITAVGVITLWWGLSRFLAPRLSLVLVGLAAWQFTRFADDLRLWGPFQGREGSDALRARIEASERAAIERNPLFGNGAGTAKVEVNEQTFFFHNSYLGLRAEGGYLLFAVLLLLVALVFWQLTKIPLGDRDMWFEAGLIGAMVIGLTLGEVLLELPVAAALGLAMRRVGEPGWDDAGREPDGSPTP